MAAASSGLRPVGMETALVHRPGDVRDLRLGEPAVAVLGDHRDDRVDPPGQIGAAGRRVVVGGVVERLHDGGGRLLLRQVFAVELLERAAGEDRTGADRREAVFLRAAARDVVGEDAAAITVHVEAGEQRDDGQALQGHAQVGPDHRGEPVGLALQGELRALDLLEVLELQLEELDHLHRQPGGAGDADRRVLVGGEDLLDVALRDDVAHGRPAVAGQHHAAGERGRHDRRAVRSLHRALHRRQRTPAGQLVRHVVREEIHERGGAGRQEGGRQTPRVTRVGFHACPSTRS